MSDLTDAERKFLEDSKPLMEARERVAELTLMMVEKDLGRPIDEVRIMRLRKQIQDYIDNAHKKFLP